jgi:polar amino acid transport system substrate-binding protein
MATLRALSAILLAAGALCAAPASACSKTMTMVTEEWPPYNYGSDQRKGLDVELAQAIFDEAGCKLVAGPPLPTVRRMMLFEQGSFDLMLAASDVPHRRQFARFSSAYRFETVGLFALEKNFAQLRDLDSFEAIGQRGLRLLAPTIGWYGPAYERSYAALKAGGQLSDYGSIEQGVRMLAANRGALIMGDTVAVQHQSQLSGVPLRQLPFVVLHAPVHLMLSKASTTAADLARIDAAIARLEKNGALKAIRQRYAPR